jgi:FKBP-type peptidyl-prolyl cis-trans isomerase 2
VKEHYLRFYPKEKVASAVLFSLIALGSAALAQNTLQIGTGSRVTLEYSVILPDKTVADTTVGKEPFSYIHGENQISPPALEKNLTGLKAGDKKRISLAAAEAYGPYEERKKVKVPKANVPPETKVGSLLRTQDGLEATVIAINDDAVLLDLNHPLAGKNLVFDVKILKVAKPVAAK